MQAENGASLGGALNVGPQGSAQRVSIGVFNGLPVAAWGEVNLGSLRQIYVKQWNGSSWIQLSGSGGPPDFVPPAVPAAPLALTASSAQINLEWVSSSDTVGVAGYLVYRGGVEVANVTSSLAYADTGLLPNTTYSYSIAAYDAAGNISVHSASAGATTYPAPVNGGALGGSVASPAGTIQLTTEGSSDWAHWGLNAATDFDHKVAVPQQIGNYAPVGAASPSRYANNSIGFTWTDGQPTSAATNSTTGIFVSGQNNGFRLTVPADSTPRTLKIYVGAWRTQGRLVAHLSDGSAADYVDTSLSNNAGVTTLGVYTLTYRAATSGQTLIVTYVGNAAGGNVALQAATLSGGMVTPDYTVGATPSGQTVVAGGSVSYMLSVSGLSGFNGSVGLSVSGLPSGVTAGFSPNTVTGSGSSTLKLSTTSSMAAGSYPLTITATSGGLTHTVNITLTMTAAPDYTVSPAPSSQAVLAGGSASYTLTIAALNGFAGGVGFAIGGLPSGVTAGFNPNMVAGGGGSTLTLSTTSGMAPGLYPLTVTATSGTLSHTANITLTVTAPVSGGTLSGSMAAPVGPIQLTPEGSRDWAHWGLTTVTDFDHKAAVTQQISNYVLVGPGTPSRYANNSIGFTWTDGQPTAAAANSTTGIFIEGQNERVRVHGARGHGPTDVEGVRGHLALPRTPGGPPERWQRGGLCGHVVEQQRGGDNGGSVHAHVPRGHECPDPYGDVHRECGGRERDLAGCDAIGRSANRIIW